MKSIVQFIQKHLVVVNLLVCTTTANLASAQCATNAAPTYSSSSEDEYFESISAAGTGVSSTISVSGITSSSTTYKNDTATQGITAPALSVVTLTISRYTTDYTAYLSVYIDWNSDHTYETSELCGTMITLGRSALDTTYSFTVPATAVTGTHLDMRVMLSEDSAGAPCGGTFGQTYDFFFVVGSGCTTPVITFSPSSHDSVCSGGGGVAITASGVGTGGTFTWSPATGLSASTGATVTANPTTSVVYSVTGTTSGSCSATYEDTVTVVSLGAIVDSVHSAGSDKICPGGGSVLLEGPAGAGYTYKWYNGGTVISHATAQDYTAIAAGSYTLKINEYGCTDSSSAVVVTVYPYISPVITFNGKALHTGSYFTTYQWYENGNPISGATKDSVIALTNGGYTVIVTDTNGCTDTTTTYNVTGLGVANIFTASDIHIYPNPASSMIHIESPITVKAIITSIEGKIITEQNNVKEMNIANLSAGIYFIELYDEGGNKLAVQKLIKN